MKKVEEAKVLKCELDFARVHPEWNVESNFNLIREEMDRLLLAADVPESYEIAALALGSRLCAVTKEAAPAIEEKPVKVVKTEEVLEAMEEQPSFSNTKEELRAMIRRQAERKLAASRQRESKRQTIDDRKESANPAHMMTALMGQGEKQ